MGPSQLCFSYYMVRWNSQFGHRKKESCVVFVCVCVPGVGGLGVEERSLQQT